MKKPTIVQDLWQLSEEELAHRFLTGKPPDLAAWSDQKLFGSLLRLSHWERRAAPLRLFWRVTTAAGLWLWTGKRFWLSDAGRYLATNLMGSYRWPIRALTMHLELATSLLAPPKKVLSVQYDRQENPRFVYPVRDELVEVETGVMLGRMLWQRKNQIQPLLWFALQRR